MSYHLRHLLIPVKPLFIAIPCDAYLIISISLSSSPKAITRSSATLRYCLTHLMPRALLIPFNDFYNRKWCTNDDVQYSQRKNELTYPLF